MSSLFECPISRRSFLKKCGIMLLSSLFIPEIIKFSHGQQGKIGLITPKPALYYRKLTKKRVQCLLCPRKCIVSNGEKGFCRVRKNRNGDYYTLVHSNPCARHIDPIEKKPLFHFLPGTTALSVATAGCNFTCKNCQNWDISQAPPEKTYNFSVTPEKMVELALLNNTPTIAYTYTEPSIFFEYMLDTAKYAHKKKIKNIYHSNGYLNQKPLEELIPYLDGANIDLKAYSNDFYQEITGGTLAPVLNTLKILKAKGVWLEITNLIIPGKNDSTQTIRNLCQWVKNELGAEVPIHFSRFYPQYKLQNLPPTPVPTLQEAAKLAHNIGLHFVYIGNIPGIPQENTYCPNCKKIIIERIGYQIKTINIKHGSCQFCHIKIPGVWQ